MMVGFSDLYKMGIHTGYGYLQYSGRLYEYANVCKKGALTVSSNHITIAIL